ncbi:MAG: hypothetical protein KDE19_05090, partial [Caldilineaceae bacterium]|nr:hypothetical protein [Caldilineaceae bacterium]
MVDGAGDPNTAQAYKDAVEALYAISYALKFMIKKDAQSIDDSVMPLEGFWWVPNMADFDVKQKDNLPLSPKVPPKTQLTEKMPFVIVPVSR